MRKAFSMLVAIIVIVMMAGLTTMVMNISGKIVQETTTQYRKEQAILLAKSYTEYAILAIQGHNIAVNGCLATVTGLVNTTQLGAVNANGANRGEGYRVTVNLQYYGPVIGLCVPGVISGSADISVLVDVNVRYSDLTDMGAGVTRFVNYNRRTLQRL